MTKKLFYSIGEVARKFDVNESLLRFWEKEFDSIKPKKSLKGTRLYQDEDIKNIELVYHLVKEKGMTIEGARNRLKGNKETAAQTYDVVSRLHAIREELLLIKAEFDQLPEEQSTVTQPE
ncbi:MAG TPA: MerR family transcriptional regulator [Bacteroidales bacterium]